MSENWPPLENGTSVRTVAIPNPPEDWTEEAKVGREFGVLGTILTHHDSAGLCYEVRHEDGVVGAYDSRELAIQIGGYDVQVAEILAILAGFGWGRHDEECSSDGSLCRHARGNIAFQEVRKALQEIFRRRVVEAHGEKVKK